MSVLVRPMVKTLWSTGANCNDINSKTNFVSSRQKKRDSQNRIGNKVEKIANDDPGRSRIDGALRKNFHKKKGQTLACPFLSKSRMTILLFSLQSLRQQQELRELQLQELQLPEQLLLQLPEFLLSALQLQQQLQPWRQAQQQLQQA